jgi:hypothetical protein
LWRNAIFLALGRYGPARRIERDGLLTREDDEAFAELLAIGYCFERATLALWPPRRGRRPPLAVDLAIAALHWVVVVDERVVDARTELLLQRAQRAGLEIPGVKGKIRPGYVKERRNLKRIRRRNEQLGTMEAARRILAETGQPMHVAAITEKILEMPDTKLTAKKPIKTVASVLGRAANKGDTFVKTSPNTFSLTSAA